jgi:hypothetical protein
MEGVPWAEGWYRKDKLEGCAIETYDQMGWRQKFYTGTVLR